MVLARGAGALASRAWFHIFTEESVCSGELFRMSVRRWSQQLRSVRLPG